MGKMEIKDCCRQSISNRDKEKKSHTKNAKSQRMSHMKFQNLNYPKPAFQGDCIPVVLNSSEQYFPYLYVTLTSMLDHISLERNYDITILSAGTMMLSSIKYLCVRRDCLI